MNLKPLLEISHLTKHYRSTTAVDDVTLSIEPGQPLGLLGPNGVGKTTTLRAVHGLLRPTSGSVSAFGRAPLAIPDAAHHIGFAFDNTGLLTNHTVHNHLVNHRLATGLPHDEMDSTVDEFDLDPLIRRRIKGLSTGERKRVNLTTAMTGRPQLLVLDEPINGLDIEGAHWLRRVLQQHVDSGGALFISSHILTEVERMVDSIVVIKHRCLFNGSFNELRHHGGPTLEDAYLNLVSSTISRSRAA